MIIRKSFETVKTKIVFETQNQIDKKSLKPSWMTEEKKQKAHAYNSNKYDRNE